MSNAVVNVARPNREQEARQSRRRFVLGSVLVAMAVLAAASAPLLAGHDPQDYAGPPYSPPSPAHPLGLDDVGHDIASLMLHGAAKTLAVGLTAAGFTLVIALVVGVTAAYRGGWVEKVLLAAIDVTMSLPFLPLTLLVAALMRPGWLGTAVVIAALGWPLPARVIRTQATTLIDRNYVASARGFGASPAYLVTRHLAPAMSPVLVALTIRLIGRGIGQESMLAFLGVGDPTQPSWGLIMNLALQDPGIWFTSRWATWLLPPGLAISLTILGFTLVALAMESRLDPRLRQGALQ